MLMLCVKLIFIGWVKLYELEERAQEWVSGFYQIIGGYLIR